MLPLSDYQLGKDKKESTADLCLHFKESQLQLFSNKISLKLLVKSMSHILNIVTYRTKY